MFIEYEWEPFGFSQSQQQTSNRIVSKRAHLFNVQLNIVCVLTKNVTRSSHSIDCVGEEACRFAAGVPFD